MGTRPFVSSEREADLHGSGSVAHREADTLEAPLGAAMPGVVRIVGRRCLVVERLDDAAATNDVEVSGHVARDTSAAAQARDSALGRFHSFVVGHCLTPHEPRGFSALRVRAERRRGGFQTKGKRGVDQ